MDPQRQAQVMGALGMGAQYGLSLPFSRDQESEADHIGLLYMARAGYDPHEAEAFWKRMNAQAGSRQPPQYASDHPFQRRAHPADRGLDARRGKRVRRAPR